jgi:hypothetical protein
MNYDWRPRNPLSRITDTATGEWHFSHDERERLAATAFTPRRVDGLMSWQESFTHDAAGNLTGYRRRVRGQVSLRLRPPRHAA